MIEGVEIESSVMSSLSDLSDLNESLRDSKEDINDRRLDSGMFLSDGKRHKNRSTLLSSNNHVQSNSKENDMLISIISNLDSSIKHNSKELEILSSEEF